jgi:hypothetical protein
LRYLAKHQFDMLWSHLGVVPDVVSRSHVANIFKRCNGVRSELGYMEFEEFLNAVVFLAVQAFSRPPYCLEYSTNAAQVRGFVSRIVIESRRVGRRYTDVFDVKHVIRESH